MHICSIKQLTVRQSKASNLLAFSKFSKLYYLKNSLFFQCINTFFFLRFKTVKTENFQNSRKESHLKEFGQNIVKFVSVKEGSSGTKSNGVEALLPKNKQQKFSFM